MKITAKSWGCISTYDSRVLSKQIHVQNALHV